MKKNILQFLYFLALLSGSLFFTSQVDATQIDLPRDSYGWTIFTPSADSRIVYVAADGNDSTGVVYTQANHPSWITPFEPGEIQAFATYEAAFANTRAGYPDWVLLKRGDVFVEVIFDSIRSGRGRSEPFLIGGYGDFGPPPIMKTGASTALRLWKSWRWIAISGIEFYAHTRNPDSPEFVDPSGGPGMFAYSEGSDNEGLLVEGCKFNFYSAGISMVVQESSATASGITVRRSHILDSYTDSGHAQGFWSDDTDDLILAENVFDHNGWYQQADYDKDLLGEATMFNHNTYMGDLKNAIFEGNIFMRPSSMHNKFTAKKAAGPITLENNLYIDGEIGIGAGTNYMDNQYRFRNMTIRDNVMLNIGRSRPTNRTLAWIIDVAGWDGGVIDSNYILHQNDPAIKNVEGFKFWDTMRNVSVTNNVMYGLQNLEAVIMKSDNSGSTNMSFNNNIIQVPTDAMETFNCMYDISEIWNISENVYYSDRPEGSRYVNNNVSLTLAEWQAETGDDSIFERITLPQENRTIESYQTAMGESATIDAFISSARGMHRYDWDTRYEADTFNDWIRNGFENDSFRSDVDNSETITSTDALLTLRRSLGLDMSSTHWQESPSTGDINCDGTTTSVDASLILRYSLDLDMSGTLWCG